MNILTFDIEDWYNCDFISNDLDWDKFEVRIYDGIEKILTELDKRKIKASFFCLGWIAEKHPDVIKQIHEKGHHIGCHSYQHELSTNLTREEFKENTLKSKKLIEDIIGEEINAYRSPGFSITENNTWAFEVLSELGFEYDCSIFPAAHDYGGFASYGKSEPAIIKLNNGKQIKEFPINTRNFLNKNIVFSGGGFFRLYPYELIKSLAQNSDYMMTYFHTRDFDPEQPMIKSLPAMRKFKSYVGLRHSFKKFQQLLDDFDFIDVTQADEKINWEETKIIEI